EIPTTYVPFRNANMLATATSWAEVLGANAIFIGAVAEDSSGYPDCHPEFYAAFQETINTGTKPDTHIAIETPIIHLSKAEIVKKGIELDAPLHLTWSCYRSEDAACGTCDSCALRLRGFEQAEIKDPIRYVDREFELSTKDLKQFARFRDSRASELIDILGDEENCSFLNSSARSTVAS